MDLCNPGLVYESKCQDEQDMVTAMQIGHAVHPIDGAPAKRLSSKESHCSNSWSNTQSPIAISSAESRLYALLRQAPRQQVVQSVIKDVGQSWSTVVCSDASAAFGVTQQSCACLHQGSVLNS